METTSERNHINIEDQYRVWVLVRHVEPIAAVDNKSAGFEVGVAFIGKRPPASYEAEPWKRYEISNSAIQTISVAEEALRPISSTDQRVLTRHNIAVDMQLEVLDDQGEAGKAEHTVTENISKKGATLFTTLEIPIGRFIRLTNEQHTFTVFAAIRATSIGVDGIPRIHVEFIDREWPL